MLLVGPQPDEAGGLLVQTRQAGEDGLDLVLVQRAQSPPGNPRCWARRNRGQARCSRSRPRRSAAGLQRQTQTSRARGRQACASGRASGSTWSYTRRWARLARYSGKGP